MMKQKSRKLKLLVFAPYFPPYVGGAENYAYHISKGLQEKYDWNVVVVTSNHEKKEFKKEKMDKMRIYRLPVWFKLSNTPINPLWPFQIRKIIKEEKPDVVNAHAPVPFMADVGALVVGRTPFFLTYHAGRTVFKKGFLIDFLINFYEQVLTFYLFKRADRVISVSDFVRSTFLKNYAEKTLVVPSGVDTDCFRPERVKTKNRVLFVGGLRKAEGYKGLEFLIEAIGLVVSEIEDVKLVVVGDGDLREGYEQLCSELGVERSVEFKGKLKARDLAGEYQKASVFVHPSLFDNCPLVLLEAMACKKPVIGSNIGGIPDVIDDGETGLLVEPRNPEILAEAIIKILRNPQLARKMGENGYQKVRKNFIWDKQIEKTEKVLRNLVR